MLAGSKRKSALWMIGGVAVAGLSPVLMLEADIGLLLYVLMIGGYAAFVWGCILHARGKGHEFWIGLLGMLGMIGLIALGFIEDKYACCTTGGPDCTHGRDKKEDWSSKAA